MERKRLAYLLDKHVNGELTPSELEEMISFVNTGKEDDLLLAIQQKMQEDISLSEPSRSIEGEEEKKSEILKNIFKVDKTYPQSSFPTLNKPERKLYQTKWLAAASVVLIMCFAGYYLWYGNAENMAGKQTTITNSAKPTDYVRNITLPDGSTVILQAGSTLSYPSSFATASREVELIGEAYFDIIHSFAHADGRKIPFIIHTGKIKTVVLGTSFNIKTYPEKKVVVSVTRGKVRVENDTKVLAILTPDQQVTYIEEGSSPVLEQVEARKTIDWTKVDMEFDGISFEDITRTLEKRYGVEIVFKNPKLKSCLLVSSFSGTESLTNVLETLATVSNSTFKSESDKKFSINGSGCQ